MNTNNLSEDNMRISEAVRNEIHRRFAQEYIDEVVTALTNADDDIAGSERIQFAILKLAQGNVEQFYQALRLASLDWRDVLLKSGMSELDWPDIVVAEGMADESWRTLVVEDLRKRSSEDLQEGSKSWWQFWK